jgi:hypothetical protein
MTTTLRLPAELKDEAQIYAKTLGVSLNGLLAVALREYLDRRPAHPTNAAHSAKFYRELAREARRQELAVRQAEATEDERLSWLRMPDSGPAAPCRCGSGSQWRHCHGPQATAD